MPGNDAGHRRLWLTGGGLIAVMFTAAVWLRFADGPAPELPGERLQASARDSRLDFIAFNADATLACVSEERPPRDAIWRLGSSESPQELSGSPYRGATTWSPTAPRLATGLMLGGVRIYEVGASKATLLWQSKEGDVFSQDWSPDGQKLALASTSWIRIHAADTGRLLREWPIGMLPVRQPVVTWSPDGARLAATGNGRIVLLDTTNGAEVKQFAHEDPNPERIAWSSNGEFLLVRQVRETGWPTYTSVYAVATGKRVRRFRCEEKHHIAEWSPEGSLLLLGAGKIRGYLKSPGLAVIDPKNGKHIATLGPPGSLWIGAGWVRSSNTVVAARANGEIWRWKLPDAIGRSPSDAGQTR